MPKKKTAKKSAKKPPMKLEGRVGKLEREMKQLANSHKILKEKVNKKKASKKKASKKKKSKKRKS